MEVDFIVKGVVFWTAILPAHYNVDAAVLYAETRLAEFVRAYGWPKKKAFYHLYKDSLRTDANCIAEGGVSRNS